jgi:adenylate cyclase
MNKTAPLLHEHAARLMNLRVQIDEEIEAGLVEHEIVATVLGRVLAHLTAAVAASHAFVYTYEEDALLHMHAYPSEPPDAARAFALRESSESERRSVCAPIAGGVLLARPLDIAGTWFGTAAVLIAADGDQQLAATALEQTAEVIDNYLFGLYAAKQKQQIMLKLGKALRHRVLSAGMGEAVQLLAESVPLGDLLLVYRAQETAESTIRCDLFRQGVRQEVSAVSQAEAAAYLERGDTALLVRLGLGAVQEEVLINGITRSVVVGKMSATSTKGAFNTFDRDLLASFAGFVRQRVVDFNKEWRTLAASFRGADVAELLAEDDYRSKYLAPREESVGILYVDIAGFTRVSETLLRTPERVARLVELWSREVVDCVWKHGGVFDKMVGDCVIGLFGPPFYRGSPAERLGSALDAAMEIRALTEAFAQTPGFEVLRAGGLQVSTGVNLAPLFVGLFGPNENFTGFSSGMNNTARLQGCAKAGEILVMEEALQQLGDSGRYKFGPEASAAVKNVAEPLRFRALSR